MSIMTPRSCSGPVRLQARTVDGFCRSTALGPKSRLLSFDFWGWRFGNLCYRDGQLRVCGAARRGGSGPFGLPGCRGVVDHAVRRSPHVGSPVLVTITSRVAITRLLILSLAAFLVANVAAGAI